MAETGGKAPRDEVFAAKPETDVSWYQAEPRLSRELIGV